MRVEHDTGRLAHLPVAQIVPNPDNPRIAFRPGELETLQESIRQYGVQVPITVYRVGARYVLIDGERRWRCASKLTLKVIPSLIQEKPTRLENLLLMFNIHALREQWDYLTIALKLDDIIKMLTSELGKAPNEVELSSRTGLTRGIIRRCRLLIDLPKKYQQMLLEELKKPKGKQALSEDLFIEMERAINTVSRAMPDLVANKDKARQMFLTKYKSGVIDNIVDFRKVGKIARAKNVHADPVQAHEAIGRLLTDATYSIRAAWTDTVAEAYAERDIVSRIDTLLAKFDEVRPSEIDDEVRDKLEELVERTKALLESDE